MMRGLYRPQATALTNWRGRFGREAAYPLSGTPSWRYFVLTCANGTGWPPANAPFNKTPSYQGVRSLQATDEKPPAAFFWDTLAFDTNRSNA